MGKLDKFLAFLAKLKSSLTVWALSAVALLTQFQPILDWIQSIAGTLAPGKVALITSIIGIVARLRSLITGALPKVDPPV
jgi:uncharacterized membrane protein